MSEATANDTEEIRVSRDWLDQREAELMQIGAGGGFTIAIGVVYLLLRFGDVPLSSFLAGLFAAGFAWMLLAPWLTSRAYEWGDRFEARVIDE